MATAMPTLVPESVPVTYSPDDPAALYARRLTAIEFKVVALVADGYDDRTIARMKKIRIARVRDLVYAVCRKLDLADRTALAIAWHCELFHLGIIALDLRPRGVRGKHKRGRHSQASRQRRK